MNTPGKGPFSGRPRPEIGANVRWVAPPTETTQRNIDELIRFCGRCDTGVLRFVSGLVEMPAAARLARCLSETLRRMAADPFISDVLVGGISPSEDAVLFQLERAGIPIHLLGVLHVLMCMRERQDLIVHFQDAFMRVTENESGNS